MKKVLLPLLFAAVLSTPLYAANGPAASKPATATAAVTLSAGAALASTGQHQVRAVDCPSGNVCVYPDATQNGQTAKYYRYGAYNLSNVFGTRSGC